jgi:hypothetical protein
MPKWHPRPETELKDTLDEVMAELEREVQTNPSFALITGINVDRLAEHGQAAVAAMIMGKTATQRSEIFTNPNMLVQIYIFGFVMGQRFAERRAPGDTPSEE